MSWTPNARLQTHFRRDDRAADCAALEMPCPRKGTGGSNPPLSAFLPDRAKKAEQWSRRTVDQQKSEKTNNRSRRPLRSTVPLISRPASDFSHGVHVRESPGLP